MTSPQTGPGLAPSDLYGVFSGGSGGSGGGSGGGGGGGGTGIFGVVTEKGRARLSGTSLPGSLVSITRTHPSGRVVPVRGATLLPLSGGAFLVWDYEIPVGLPVSYQAAAYDPADTSTPIDVSTPATVTWVTPNDWLKDPLEPTRNMPITLREFDTATYTSRTGVFDVLRRPAPVTIGEVRRAASGEFSVFTYTKTERDRLNYITASGNPLLLQSTQESGIGSMYFAVLDLVEDRIINSHTEQRRAWTVNFQEVDAPIGAPAPTVTWQDLADLYPGGTWADVAPDWTSWLDLAEGLDVGSRDPIVTWRGA